MNFLCPACKTPLPVATPVVVACARCGVEVDLTRIDTAPGQARLWPEVDLTGETLGTFTLQGRAGSGGMGTVYVADGLAGRCAVKVLSAQLAADPSLRERFRREAQALRQVEHPGVVRIIDEGQQNGFCWYAMEHVDGKDLRARLAEGPLPAAEVEALARQLLEALAAVHDAQLVHRDLKPGNILLAASGARLCDFGIARFDGATTLTESAALLGSLRYMAPEQRAGVSTAKSDLYSLGLVLHEAATGGLPGERELPGGRLGRLIDALLQTNPQRRPKDARSAASLIALPTRRNLGAAALVASSLLGVTGFVAWTLLASRLGPEPIARLPPPPQLAAVVDAGPGAAVNAAARATDAVDAGDEVAAEQEPRIPQVVADSATVEGDLSAALINKVVGENQRSIASCYETALKTNPAVQGRIAARIIVRSVEAGGRFYPALRSLVLAGGKMKKEKFSKGPEPRTDADPDAGARAPPAPEPKPAPQSGAELNTEAPAPKVTAKRPSLRPRIDVELAASTVRDPDLDACVIAAIRRWKLPLLPRLKAVVTLGWTFSPTGGLQLLQQQPSTIQLMRDSKSAPSTKAASKKRGESESAFTPVGSETPEPRR
jgi:serine/threonine protein kinase